MRRSRSRTFSKPRRPPTNTRTPQGRIRATKSTPKELSTRKRLHRNQQTVSEHGSESARTEEASAEHSDSARRRRERPRKLPPDATIAELRWPPLARFCWIPLLCNAGSVAYGLRPQFGARLRLPGEIDAVSWMPPL
jgi:hypothetical protein